LNTEAGEGEAELPQASIDISDPMLHDINYLDGVVGGDDTLPLPMDPDEDDRANVYKLRLKRTLKAKEKPRHKPRMLPIISGRIPRPEFGQSYQSEMNEFMTRVSPGAREEPDLQERGLPRGDYLRRMYGGG